MLLSKVGEFPLEKLEIKQVSQHCQPRSGTESQAQGHRVLEVALGMSQKPRV